MGTAEVVRTHTAQDTQSTAGSAAASPSQDRSILYPKLCHFLLQLRFWSLYILLRDKDSSTILVNFARENMKILIIDVQLTCACFLPAGLV